MFKAQLNEEKTFINYPDHDQGDNPFEENSILEEDIESE